MPLFVAFCAGLATASRIKEAHSAGKPKLAEIDLDVIDETFLTAFELLSRNKGI